MADAKICNALFIQIAKRCNWTKSYFNIVHKRVSTTTLTILRQLNSFEYCIASSENVSRPCALDGKSFQIYMPLFVWIDKYQKRQRKCCEIDVFRADALNSIGKKLFDKAKLILWEKYKWTETFHQRHRLIELSEFFFSTLLCSETRVLVF